MDTAHLAADFDLHARPLARGRSLAQLRDIREHAWFSEHGAADIPLHDYLTRLAARYLDVRGSQLQLRNRSDIACAHEWRLLTLHLPADMLVAARWCGESGEPGNDRVALLSRGLRERLRQPVAETHLHLGAALEFGVLWTGLQHALAGRSLRAEQLRALQPPFGDARLWLRRLSCAALARLLLASYLRHRELFGADWVDLRHFVREALPELFPDARERVRVLQPMLAAIAELLGQPERVSEVELRRALRSLWANRYRDRFASGDELLAADPLARWLPAHPDRALPETRLIARSLRYLDDAVQRGASDEGFARVLSQYLRIRTQLHAHLVETPSTAGLDWFQRHYERLACYRQSLEPLTLEQAIRLESRDVNLRALEVRTTPGRRWPEITGQCRELARTHARVSAPAGREFGLVYHFVKSARDGRGREHACPSGLFYACRHGRWIADTEARARALATALRHHPELLLVFRGVDVASTELAQPTWALLGPMQIIRSAASRAARRLDTNWEIAGLHTTLHLGEEYRTPNEGLRRVHEALEFGLLGRGDRIGHGLILGCDLDAWFGQNASVLQPLGERLDDLIWEFERYANRDVSATGDRILSVQRRAEALARIVYGPALDGATPLIDALIRARALRHDLGFLRSRYGVPRFRWPRSSHSSISDLAGELLTLELGDEGVYERSQRVIEFDADDSDLNFTRDMQRCLIERLANLEICIEANPSSNFVIHDLARLQAHPIFEFSRPGAAPGPGVSINSDDPLTFATCLADEYAHFEQTLLSLGQPATQVLDWLDRARQAGMDSRFTSGASTNPDSLVLAVGGWWAAVRLAND